MYLQRLVADKEIGFNYDYMGSAEYEFGATLNGRSAFARAYLEGDIAAKKTLFVEKFYGSLSKPVEVVVMGRKKDIEAIGAEMVISVTKESFRTESSKIIGWMNVGRESCTPFFIMRADLADAGKRIESFFAPAIEAIKEELAG